jgi:DNA-binding NarL/FixJ family response regulator
MTAPLQLIGLTFPLDVDVESRLLAEVDRIQGRGVVRVLDMVLMARGRDGVLEELEIGDTEDFGSLLASGDGAAGEPAGSGVAAVQALADSLEPGSAVALLLVEHLWAGPLVDAVSAAGGALISDDFLTGDVSLAVGAEVAAVEEASAVIAEAQAAEATAMLRAIAASAEAAEAQDASERIQEAAAAEAVSALIAAGLIEAAAAHQAVTALTTAGLITDAAAQASDQAVADAAATIAAADQAAAEAVAEDDALIDDADQAAAEAVAEDDALIDDADQAAAEAVAEDLALMEDADQAAGEATNEAQARTRAASITRSEAQILQYLPQPVPFSVIADKLGISRSAAKERAERLYQRLGVHSRDDAVSRARALGLLGR